MKLSSRDREHLALVHPDLVKVVHQCAKITTVPFMVLETARSIAQQKKNITKGVSWTMNSRHIVSKDGLCRAVDLVPIDNKGNVIWAWPVYYRLMPFMKTAAKTVKVPIEWGGDWKSAKDGPHWQLPWKQYP